jgi:hypothetical protein
MSANFNLIDCPAAADEPPCNGGFISADCGAIVVTGEQD